MVAPTEIHQGEWLRVRAVQPGQAAPVLGYVPVAGDRTVGTRAIDLCDDFLSINVYAGAVVLVGCTNPVVTLSSGGIAAGTFGVDAVSKAQGVVNMVTSVTPSYVGLCTSTFSLGQARTRLWWRVHVAQLATVAQDFDCIFGFSDGITAGTINPATFCGWRYSRAVDGNFWVARSFIAAAETKTVSTIAPSTAGYQTLEIDINETGEFARFYMNQGDVQTKVAIHNVAYSGRTLTAGMLFRKTNGVANVNLDVDFYRLLMTQGSERP